MSIEFALLSLIWVLIIVALLGSLLLAGYIISVFVDILRSIFKK